MAVRLEPDVEFGGDDIRRMVVIDDDGALVGLGEVDPCDGRYLERDRPARPRAHSRTRLYRTTAQAETGADSICQLVSIAGDCFRVEATTQ